MSNVHASRQTVPSEPPIIPSRSLDLDPHGIFRRYRTLTPLIRRDDGAYLVIRAGDVESLATDTRTRQVETELLQSRGVRNGALFDFFENSMLLSNGPAHRRRRAPLSRAFAFGLVTELRPRIRAIAQGLIDGVYAKGEMSFLEQYAAVLPAQILSEILGLPETDIPRFTSWVYQLSRALSGSFAREEIPQIDRATSQLIAYVGKLLGRRRENPTGDFLTSYTAAIEPEGGLSPQETLMQIVTVMLAGSDTTRAAMTMQVGLLLQHRDQWAAVCRKRPRSGRGFRSIAL